jgi:mannose-6-phosphate isomerase-like protein (cupin superfamily)
VLNAGDSIYYDSIVPHEVRAYGSEPAQILAVVYTPV